MNISMKDHFESISTVRTSSAKAGMSETAAIDADPMWTFVGFAN